MWFFDQDNNTPIICLFSPPELHLLIGPFNKIYIELEVISSQIVDWQKACNVKKEEHYDESFAGNDSRKLLKDFDWTEALIHLSCCGMFVSAFKSFNEVVSSCYGNELYREHQCKPYLLKLHEIRYHLVLEVNRHGRVSMILSKRLARGSKVVHRLLIFLEVFKI